jgi:hypothetical protein
MYKQDMTGVQFSVSTVLEMPLCGVSENGSMNNRKIQTPGFLQMVLEKSKSMSIAKSRK